jgi:putative hemolysin
VERQTLQIPLVPILPPPLRPVAQPLALVLQNLLLPADVAEAIRGARGTDTAAQFASRVLDSLEIRFAVDDHDLSRIPKSGPAILAANHPYGIVDGLILLVLLERVRADCKVLANSWLGWIGEIRRHMILVNPFASRSAQSENRRPLRQTLSWLDSGGLLAVFPAGEVAHMNWKEHAISDPEWKTTAARLALRSRCPVVPAYFEGANSIPFQIAGMVHPGLRTISLAREFARMRGRTVRLRIGAPIPPATLSAYGDAGRATAYMRHRTYLLANRSATSTPAPRSSPGALAIARPADAGLLSEEVAALPPECELLSDRNFSVYLAEALQIPLVLTEIGRCRELAFRNIGEGTGRPVDLDRFDDYYQHLFLWHKADCRVAGAYRLAVTTDVLPLVGAEGLYTSTLFRFDPQLFERVGPAVELGRSFVVPDYQKNYAALLLLWKGITRAVQRRPEASVLFGAVSISATYSAFSRSLIAAYLSDRMSHELSRMVLPRKKFRPHGWGRFCGKGIASACVDIEDVSVSISDIEADGKGVPVLIRQYLKAGGRILGFTVDPQFNNTLDALMLVDLREAPRSLLERCMGRGPAQAFRISEKLA